MKTMKKNLREKLLQAGVEELCLQGVESFSVRRIAAKCGVSCAAPYKHFADKQTFITAIFEHINDQWLAIEAQVLADCDGSSREKLLCICTAYIRFLVDNPHFRSIIMTASSGYSANFRARRCRLTDNTTLLVEEYARTIEITPEVRARKLYVARSLIYGAALLFDNGDLAVTEENMQMVRDCIDREFDLP